MSDGLSDPLGSLLRTLLRQRTFHGRPGDGRSAFSLIVVCSRLVEQMREGADKGFVSVGLIGVF
jgi:hypothetical protein